MLIKDFPTKVLLTERIEDVLNEECICTDEVYPYITIVGTKSVSNHHGDLISYTLGPDHQLHGLEVTAWKLDQAISKDYEEGGLVKGIDDMFPTHDFHRYIMEKHNAYLKDPKQSPPETIQDEVTMKINARHKVGDKVYLSPSSEFVERYPDDNPLHTVGTVVDTESDIAEANNWIKVDWGEIGTNSYRTYGSDLMTPEEYLTCREYGGISSASTTGRMLTFVDEVATYDEQKALDYAQKPTYNDIITKLADDIYEKARMNLSTSQSWELKDIVLELLNEEGGE